MKTLTSASGVAIAFLLLCLAGCTPKQTLKPIPLRAEQPLVVTRYQYQPIPPSLLPVVEASWGFSNVWANGDMYSALAHDSGQLDTCKAALDGIRTLAPPALPAPTPAPAPAPTPAALPPKP